MTASPAGISPGWEHTAFKMPRLTADLMFLCCNCPGTAKQGPRNSEYPHPTYIARSPAVLLSATLQFSITSPDLAPEKESQREMNEDMNLTASWKYVETGQKRLRMPWVGGPELQGHDQPSATTYHTEQESLFLIETSLICHKIPLLKCTIQWLLAHSRTYATITTNPECSRHPQRIPRPPD